MKERWLWNPNTERILDMKYKKSYSRMDFKEIFKILVRTERRRQALRKMASKSEKGRLNCENTYTKRLYQSRRVWYNETRETERENDILKRELNEHKVGMLFHKSSKEEIIKIIKESDTKEEIVKRCKELYLM